MNAMKSLLAGAALLFAFALVAPQPAAAAVGCGAGVSDCMLVFDANGNLLASTSVLENQENPNQIYTVNGIAPDPNQFGNATSLVEPNAGGIAACQQSAQFCSDVFGVASVNGNLVLGFSSDDENTTPFGNQGANFLIENTAGPYDATRYLSPDLQAAGDTARFFSDVEAPEPGSLMLIGSALLGFGWIRRRRNS